MARGPDFIVTGTRGAGKAPVGDPPAWTDVATQVELDAVASVYAPQIPALVAAHDPRLCKAAGGTDANIMLGARVIVPRTGTLTDFYIWPTVSTGNVDGAVYSTAATRVRLWSSGSVACPAAGGWRSLGNPALAVTAGTQLDFAVANTLGTAAFVNCHDTPALGMGALPTGFFTAPDGASPKVYWYVYSYPAPATLTEASLTAYSYAPFAMARIV